MATLTGYFVNTAGTGEAAVYKDLSEVFEPLTTQALALKTGFISGDKDLNQLFAPLCGPRCALDFNTNMISVTTGKDLATVFSKINPPPPVVVNAPEGTGYYTYIDGLYTVQVFASWYSFPEKFKNSTYTINALGVNDITITFNESNIRVWATVTGGGGGGGGYYIDTGTKDAVTSYRANAGGGGGGGGRASVEFFTKAGSTYNIIVGAGGASGENSYNSAKTPTDGSAGGTSSIADQNGTIVVAEGKYGTGGKAATNATYNISAGGVGGDAYVNMEIDPFGHGGNGGIGGGRCYIVCNNRTYSTSGNSGTDSTIYANIKTGSGGGGSGGAVNGAIVSGGKYGGGSCDFYTANAGESYTAPLIYYDIGYLRKDGYNGVGGGGCGGGEYSTGNGAAPAGAGGSGVVTIAYLTQDAR
jgi:hypothetical protein